MTHSIKSKILQWFPLVLLSTSFFVFFGTWRLFYQQDEWQQLGLIISGFYKANPFADLSVTQILLGQGRALSNGIYYFFFKSTPFDITVLMLLGLLLHSLNAWLLYVLGFRLFASRTVAVIASLFFTINAVSQQTVTWVAAFGTLPASTCIIASMLFYLRSLDEEHRFSIVFSFIFFLISLLFKEIGIFLIIFYPILFCLYSQRLQMKYAFSKTWPFLIYGAAAVVFRLYELAMTTETVGTLTTGTEGFWTRLFLHLILYPLTGVPQIFVPPSLFYKLSKSIAFFLYPYLTSTPLNDLICNSVVNDMLSIIFAFLILAIILYAIRSDQQRVKPVVAATLFLILSFLPYIVIDRQGSYFDSRYYYVAAMGGSLLVGYLMERLWQLRWPFRLLMPLLFLVLATAHISNIKSEISSQLAISTQRRALLQQMKQLQPTLPPKAVIFLSSDTNYITANNYLPFQQGTGYTIMVWYIDSGTISGTLLREKYLWDLGSEGYREVDGNGFGFFTDRVAFLKAYEEYHLNQENIVALTWNGKRQQLVLDSDPAKLLLIETK